MVPVIAPTTNRTMHKTALPIVSYIILVVAYLTQSGAPLSVHLRSAPQKSHAETAATNAEFQFFFGR